MKKILLFLLIFSSLQAYASQLVIGLRSENIVAWNIWEYEKGALKQYLLLFNKGEERREVKVKLIRFKSAGTSFEVVPTDITFHGVNLAPDQLLKLSFPEKEERLDFLEFFENGEGIGMLGMNNEQPGKSFLRKKYRHYTNSGINGGYLGYWVRFTTIYDPKANVSFVSDNLKKNDMQLIKADIGEKDSFHPNLILASVTDRSIVKLTKKGKVVDYQLHLKQTDEPFIPVLLMTSYYENGREIMGAYQRLGLFPDK